MELWFSSPRVALSGANDILQAAHAVLAQNSAVRFHPHLAHDLPSEENNPALYAPISSLDGDDPAERIMSLTVALLQQFIDEIPDAVAPDQLGILLLLPLDRCFSNGDIDKEDWQQSLHEQLDIPDGLQLALTDTTRNFKPWLEVVERELKRTSLAAIAVLTVDSLVDAVMLNKLSASRRLAYRHRHTGYVPGEAASLLVLHAEQPDPDIWATHYQLVFADSKETINKLLSKSDSIVFCECPELAAVQRQQNSVAQFHQAKKIQIGQTFGDLGVASQPSAIAIMAGLIEFQPDHYQVLSLLNEDDNQKNILQVISQQTPKEYLNQQDPFEVAKKEELEDLESGNLD